MLGRSDLNAGYLRNRNLILNFSSKACKEQASCLLHNNYWRWGASQFCKKHFFIVVRASPLASTIRERGRSHYKCKTDMLPGGVCCQLCKTSLIKGRSTKILSGGLAAINKVYLGSICALYLSVFRSRIVQSAIGDSTVKKCFLQNTDAPLASSLKSVKFQTSVLLAIPAIQLLNHLD